MTTRASLGWTTLGLVAFGVTAAAFAGCGSDSTNDNPGTTDDGGGGDGSVQGDGSGGGDGGACLLVGSTCATNDDCCSAQCDATTKICSKPIGACKASGDACTTANECCTFVCNGGKCGADLCISDGKACTSDASCCGGKCAAVDGGSATCVPLNATCKTSGNECAANGNCCSKLCSNGRCENQPSFCTQNGDVCSTNTECCGGLCTKAAGAAVGTCSVPAAPGATQCQVAGQVCGAGAATDGGALPTTDGGVPACGGDCCSRSCAPYGPTGVNVCQPPSGCHPTGEVCRTDKDCCGAPGLPGGNETVHCAKANASDPVGRCDNGNACRAAGAVCKLASTSCNAENDCCAGNVNKDPTVCLQDTLGIPRCTIASGGCKADGGSRAGEACASSADCCGLACVPNPTAGGSPFICDATCVNNGGKCTTNADCCTGLPCVTQPGSTVGTCGSSTSGGTTDGGTTGTDGGTTGTDGGTTGTDAGTGGACGLYGQACTTAANCCNGVPCTDGRCYYPIQ